MKSASLRESLLDSIGNFLYEEGFANDPITKLGVLEIINLISDYQEEGSLLFPEVLITNDLEFFKTIPNREIVIQTNSLSVEGFKSALKLCAPLATNSWIIFIEVKDGKLKYGLCNAEMSVTSPSIYNQTVGELKIELEKVTIAYIRNIGQKTVELRGLKKQLTVSLNLDDPKQPEITDVNALCAAISANSNVQFRINIQTYFGKLIDGALKDGHGNLIGVVNDDVASVTNLQKSLKKEGGVYLDVPIDIAGMVVESEENKSSETAVNLLAYSSIIKEMINHDGITVFTNTGKLLGYHLLIDNFIKPEDKIDSGTRSKAFLSMKNCGGFEFCFFKSQDGNIKTWKK